MYFALTYWIYWNIGCIHGTSDWNCICHRHQNCTVQYTKHHRHYHHHYHPITVTVTIVWPKFKRMNVDNSIFIILNFNQCLGNLSTGKASLMASSIKMHAFIKVVLKAKSISFSPCICGWRNKAWTNQSTNQRANSGTNQPIQQKMGNMIFAWKVGQFRTKLDYIFKYTVK